MAIVDLSARQVAVFYNAPKKQAGGVKNHRQLDNETLLYIRDSIFYIFI